MPISVNSQQLSRKAFEICYAAFRVGSSIENRVFVEHLEAWSLFLLEAVTASNQEKANTAIINMEYLVSLARDLNFLNPANSDIFLREIRGINSAIAESFTSSNSDVDLSRIFTGDNKPISNVSTPAVDAKNDPQESATGVSVNGYGGGNFGNSAIRQSAIVEKIRKNKICRLRDFQDIFPDASERTIRYDVQNLIEQGIVERIGNGGPATAYRLKDEITQELQIPSYSPSQ